MVVTKVRKSLLTVLMALTIMLGLITGFAHTNAVPQTSSIHTIHGQVAGWCPAPPKICSPIG